MSDETVTVDGHEIELSNLDKVLFPESGLTKADLVDYYRRIAEVALVHYRDRPLTMERFPDGIGEEGFIQKDAPDYFPDWIERAELKKAGGTVSSVIANNAATLVYLANQGCITPHLGLSRIDQVDKPDRLMFDLDPSVDDFAKVQAAARWLRELLESLEITSFVQITGSRGLHVVVPLERSASFDEIRKCAARLADVLARQHPEDLTVEQRKAKRGERVYLDIARNAYGQTAAAPYGVRARPGAPIATPLDWDEALAHDLSPRKYTIKNIFRRLAAKDDPWAKIGKAAIATHSLLTALDAIELGSRLGGNER
jgi:bifunctional non-homologous end joining protein LigD